MTPPEDFADRATPLPVKTLRLGQAELTLVPDGEMHVVPGVGLFGAPKDVGWAGYLPPDDGGHVKVMPNSLLVRGLGEGAVLVDAGGENALERPGRRTDFLARLDALGVRREEVRTLVVTHAHLDHIGYLTVPVDNGRAPAFPNAQVFIQRAGAEAFASADPGRWARYFAPAERAGLLRVIEGDVTITPGVTCLATPGHTPGHQSVMIDAGDGSAVYAGDLAVTKLHLEHPEWCPEWTWLREAEIASKRKLTDLALARDAVVVFGHDPRMPFGRLRRRGGVVEVLAVDAR